MSDTAETAAGTYRLGVSRPDLDVADLPAPEEVFGVPRIGFKELFMYAVGPSLIVLGISIGSGEWLLGPQAVGQFGFLGVGWVITISALLQTFYNVEVARYTMATGEAPVVGWARVPPGKAIWLPISVFLVIFAFISGGWAASAGEGIYAVIHGAAPAEGLEEPRLYAMALLALVFLLTVIARKITRAMELANWAIVGAILLLLLIVDLIVVPWEIWWEGITSFVTPAAPPEGMSATQLGGLAGFTALASGLNWYVLGHYRDKGYGMGHRAGFIAGGRGGRTQVLSVGVTFNETEQNQSLWKRWYRLLMIDMWGVFFIGAMLGMLLPTILMRHAVNVQGAPPTDAQVPTFVASALQTEYGNGFFYVALVVGVLVMFSTQLGIFEGIARVTTDAANTNERLRERINGDPRRFYWPFMIAVAVVISIVLHLGLPVALVTWSANLSNLGALIFPFALMYLNSRLPKTARPRPHHYVILVLNFLFFGFFFLNFLVEQVTGSPIATF